MRNLNTLRAGISLIKDGNESNQLRFNFTSSIIGTESLKRDRVQPSTVNQLTNIATASGENDTYIYLRNTGTASFDVRNAAADAGVFATLAPSEFMFFRLQKAKDLYVKNLSSHEIGEVELSYWQAEQNVE